MHSCFCYGSDTQNEAADRVGPEAETRAAADESLGSFPPPPIRSRLAYHRKQLSSESDVSSSDSDDAGKRRIGRRKRVNSDSEDFCPPANSSRSVSEEDEIVDEDEGASSGTVSSNASWKRSVRRKISSRRKHKSRGRRARPVPRFEADKDEGNDDDDDDDPISVSRLDQHCLDVFPMMFWLETVVSGPVYLVGK